MESLSQSPCRQKKLRPFKPKPRKKLKAGQKLKPKHNGIVKKFAGIAMRDSLPDYRPEQVFQEFLARCAVDVSAKMGILGDVQKLSVAGDGTPFYSGASHYGTKVCDCKEHGVYDCSAPDVIPTLMQDGVGTATGNSGSMAIPSLTSLLPTVPTTFPFTCVKHRHQDMTASLPFLPCLRSENFILTFASAIL